MNCRSGVFNLVERIFDGSLALRRKASARTARAGLEIESHSHRRALRAPSRPANGHPARGLRFQTGRKQECEDQKEFESGSFCRCHATNLHLSLLYYAYSWKARLLGLRVDSGAQDAGCRVRDSQDARVDRDRRESGERGRCHLRSRPLPLSISRTAPSTGFARSTSSSI